MEITFTSGNVIVYDSKNRKVVLDHAEALRLAEEIMGWIG